MATSNYSILKAGDRVQWTRGGIDGNVVYTGTVTYCEPGSDYADVACDDDGQRIPIYRPKRISN